MAIEKGFIKCPERHCSEIAEVMQAGGKRSTLYTKCRACGTNQGNGVARQKYLSENLKVSREDVEIVEEKEAVSDTVEKAAIPSKNAASSVSDDTAQIPTKEPEQIPKGTPAAPPVLLGVGVLLATIITAIFATRKPTNKPKGQTA
jgi:hypothetical protein